MRNIEQEINESYHNFIASYDHVPEYLYLGSTAYKAFLVIMKDRITTEKPKMSTKEKPYMGMTVMRVANNDTHVNCA